MINIGETFLVFSIENTQMSLPRLTIKRFSGSDNGDMKTFEPTEYVTAFIFIGRSKKCEVGIDDCLLSKVQCSVFYDMVTGWSIADGNPQQGKESTNGTWLYVSDEVEIVNGMTIKAYQTLFQVNAI